jgi:hypothetical protein
VIEGAMTPFELPDEYVAERTKDGASIESGFHPATVAWWADLWRSPMAGEFVESDRHGLLILAILVDQFHRTPSTSLAAEIRLQRQCFGLSPLDRRRLEWEIDRVESPKRDRARGAQPPAPAKAAADPRRILASVP